MNLTYELNKELLLASDQVIEYVGNFLREDPFRSTMLSSGAVTLLD